MLEPLSRCFSLCSKHFQFNYMSSLQLQALYCVLYTLFTCHSTIKFLRYQISLISKLYKMAEWWAIKSKHFIVREFPFSKSKSHMYIVHMYVHYTFDPSTKKQSIMLTAAEWSITAMNNVKNHATLSILRTCSDSRWLCTSGRCFLHKSENTSRRIRWYLWRY